MSQTPIPLAPIQPTGLGTLIATPLDIFNPAAFLSQLGLLPAGVEPQTLGAATVPTIQPLATTANPSVAGAVKPQLPVTVGGVPAAAAPVVAANAAAAQAQQAANVANQAKTQATAAAQQAQIKAAATPAPAVQTNATAATQAAKAASECCTKCTAAAQQAQQAAQVAAAKPAAAAQAAGQAQQAAQNAVGQAKQAVTHAQEAISAAGKTGPVVTIAPANAAAAATPGYLDLMSLTQGLSNVPGVNAITGIPQQVAASLGGAAGAPSLANVFGNPANALQGGLFGTPSVPVTQIVGNPKALTTSYIEWKRDADYEEYLSERKYFTWRHHCNHKMLEDWTRYGEWKEKDWKDLKKCVPYIEFIEWKATANQEDSDHYKEWRNWRELKSKFKSRYEPQEQKYLNKKKSEYLRFIKRVDIKEYAKFLKFKAWIEGAEIQKLDIYDLDAYANWAQTYIWDKEAVKSAYNDRVASRRDFEDWVKWMRFQKLRKAAVDNTDATDSLPAWHRRDKNYSKKYQRWWRRRHGDDDADVDYEKESRTL